MIKYRFLREWPLAAFSLAIQLACGLAIATTVAILFQPGEPSAAIRVLGIAVFPMTAFGSLLSLLHLGRPLSAWRSLKNFTHSRLSREVVLTSAFALAAFADSLVWLTRTSTLYAYTGATASILGIAAVLASAAVYQVSARPVWNSAWVTASFLGSTVMVIGLALLLCWTPSSLGTITVLVGGLLTLVSGVWMWVRLSCPLGHAKWFHLWFTGHLLLIASVPALLVSFQTNSLPTSTAALACCAVALGVIIGRLLMFALAELEPRF